MPCLWSVTELVRVDDTQHQHGVDDDHPPEDVARDTPPAITQLQQTTSMKEHIHIIYCNGACKCKGK